MLRDYHNVWVWPNGAKFDLGVENSKREVDSPRREVDGVAGVGVGFPFVKTAREDSRPTKRTAGPAVHIREEKAEMWTVVKSTLALILSFSPKEKE